MSGRSALVLVALLVGAAGARADEPEDSTNIALRAKTRFDAGRAHFEAGRYRDALVELGAAYALAPFPELLYNIARCHEALGEVEPALAGYRTYRVLASGEARVDVDERIARLAARGTGPAPPPIVTRRPIYKRAWFWGVLGGSAAALAVGAGVGAWAAGRADSAQLVPHLR